MRPFGKAILAGVAAIALVGVAGLAAAQIKNAHVLDVRLSDGSRAHIRYFGDTPPTVTIAPAPMALSIFSPTSDPFGPESPFATLGRISDAMDRQAEAILRAASAQPALALDGLGLTQVDVGNLPSDAKGVSIVSTMSGDGLCIRSVEYRSLGDGRPPQILTRSSGSCATDQGQPPLSVTAGSPPQAAPREREGRQAI